jgi:hypothetical protein
MDAIGKFIATLHGTLGHDKAAALIGVPPGDKGRCVLCRFEREPTQENKAAVYAALAAGS